MRSRLFLAVVLATSIAVTPTVIAASREREPRDKSDRFVSIVKFVKRVIKTLEDIPTPPKP